DYQTTSGMAFFGMKSVFAGFERSMIRDRTKAGKLVKAKRGLYVGGSIPLGYVLDTEENLLSGEKNPNFGKFKPYQPHAEIVKEIFLRLNTGNYNCFTLALAFRKEGLIIPEFNPESSI